MAGLAEPPAKLLATVESVRQRRGLSPRELAQAVGISYNSLRAYYDKRSRVPSGDNLLRLREFIQRETPRQFGSQANDRLTHAAQQRLPISAKEARARVTRVAVLLEILSEELAWFRDGSPEAREVYRSRLDAFDAGYVSSLVSMLFDEDKFSRWLELSTNRPRVFRRASG